MHRIVALCALAALLWLGGCKTTIQHGLDERQANRILVALRQAGISATKVKERGRGNRFAIEVPKGEASRAIAVLRHRDLPRRRKPGFGVVFGKSSLIPSAAEQRARFLHALSGELARTLEAANGVLEARVHLVTPRRDPLALKDEKRSPPRASVFLRVRPGVLPLTEDEVQRIVAGGVQDLLPDRVAVVFRPSRQRAPPAASKGLAQVGPVSVSRDSKSTLLLMLGGGLILILVLAGGIVFLTLRLGKLRDGEESSKDD